jgi:hypothetical protein
MNGGAKFLGYTAILAITACGGQQGKLTIRSIGAPMSTQAKPVPFRIAEARSQFALGNVGLALESFRKAIREDPRSIEAMTGVAACYERMGRYDLARKHYEAALAIEPANASVLAALAASLDQQGKSDEAAAVRGEIRQRLAMVSPVPATAKPVASVPIPVPEPVVAPGLLGQGTVSPVAAKAVIESPAPTPPIRAVTAPAHNPPARTAISVRSVAVAVTPTASAQSVTIKLPPSRSAVAAPSRQAAVQAEVSMAPAPVKPAQAVAAALPVAPNPAPIDSRSVVPAVAKMGTGPRLERTSMAEVTLVTRRGEPMWRPQLVQRTARSATVRFVPLRPALARIPIRVLNAARVDRLAANTRLIMARRGWKNVIIGNAPAARTRSLILYPAEARPAARRLAAQLGFASALRAGSRQVTVLLGRDASRLMRKRSTA